MTNLHEEIENEKENDEKDSKKKDDNFLDGCIGCTSFIGCLPFSVVFLLIIANLF